MVYHNRSYQLAIFPCAVIVVKQGEKTEQKPNKEKNIIE